MLGHKLSDITHDIAKAFNLKCNILPTNRRSNTNKDANKWISFKNTLLKSCVSRRCKKIKNGISNVEANSEA